MFRPALVIATLIMLTCEFVTIAQAEITAEQVRKAIDRGVSHLKSKQAADGTWPDFATQQEGGVTALCTLALLNSGVDPEDPQLKRSLDWLRDHRLQSTYTVSLQTMVFCRAGPSKYRLLIDRNVKWIEKTQIDNGPRKGAWSYPGQAGGDNSNSQFALLALHEAQRVGVAVRPQTWRLAKDYWQDCQNPDGSWGYWKGRPGTGSMTCAGITSMIIVNDKVHPTDAKVVGETVHCCNRGETEADRLSDAMGWLAKNFRITGNPGPYPKQWTLYYLYGLERVGRLSAQRFIGRHDWYREGADYLVNDEIAGADYWRGALYAESNDLIATSLALLFLSKGRWPVLIAKLSHPPGDDWDQHRADVANLTRYVESQWKMDMTWQVINLSVAEIDDLVQSPVLFYSGRTNPLPRGRTELDRLAANIRGYLDRGGFLLAEANCGGQGFDEGFRELMKKVFPEPEYALRLLPPEHPIWRAEQPVDPRQLRPLLGIDFGCRTSVLYAPPDDSAPPEGGQPRASLSCLWELSYGRDVESYPASVQEQIKAAQAIGINILAYATNRELKPKDEIPRLITKIQADALAERGSVTVANLQHPGGCNTAPRALVNLLEAAAAELNLRTRPESQMVPITAEELFNYHMAFMHGRTVFTLTPAERKQLAEFVERGGLLLANSICGSKAFTDSFRREMEAAFLGKHLERIPADDPLLTRAYGGFDLSLVTRRDPQGSEGGGPLKASLRKVPPTLEGIKFGDRWGVIFSPYDLSCALEKHNSLECQGYIREDAARIGLNVLLYSLQQ